MGLSCTIAWMNLETRPAQAKDEKEYDSQGRPPIGRDRLSKLDLLQTNRLHNCPYKGTGFASHLKVYVRSGNISTDFLGAYVRIRAYDNKGVGVTKVTSAVVNTASPTWNQWLDFGNRIWLYMDLHVLENGQNLPITSKQTILIEKGEKTNVINYEMSYETCHMSSYVVFDYKAIPLVDDRACNIWPRPCLNGGTCLSNPDQPLTNIPYLCRCASGWGGENCQYRRGRLQVYARRGYNLPDEDCCSSNSAYFSGHSDPYMQVIATSHSGNITTRNSPVVRDSPSLAWNTWLDFGVDTWYTFTVSVWDYDTATESDALSNLVTITPVYGFYIQNWRVCSTNGCTGYAYFHHKFQAA